MASRSSHLVDPAIRSALQRQPALELNAQSPSEVRRVFADLYAPNAVSDDEVVLETIHVPGPAGDIQVLAYRKAGSTGTVPALLHFHASGFAFGLPEIAHRENRGLVRDRDIALFSVDYRLAPETPYPGQLDDGRAVLAWLRGHADDLGIDGASIGVKGESASGCLAAALALAVRDRGDPPLAFQILTFPNLDDRTGSGAELHPYTGEFVWTAEHNAFGWTALLGRLRGGNDVPYLAAPALAPDLSGLPPAYVAVGGLDLFVDEDLEYARRLSRAGVPVELHVYPGAVHGFGQVPGSWIDTRTYGDLSHALGRFLAKRD